ncbi:hypothetical protein DSM106972_078170 [Dulcicalothrix desertica PCC 7102]|uniref:Uncharacterized protein n=1 Tax=Dulcicalothrix desertica PCC 7102 TaxID=232991 RepID=A0A433UZT8_9CYAN|nr:hypothetical protein [Dulcicalothrix desertica]RUS99375.1 hypothetical protein DSM106972_078170 [Dulcicalothrix desertica PCC 7102]TWH50035.1 hypothetical protein CAL7102_04315 [Dulcicalothrix desertica PCC 7102]
MFSQVLEIEYLSHQQKDAMYLLLGNHFDGVRRDVFESDLSKKNWVILLEDEKTQQLKGFSTLLIYTTQFNNENINIVYSGDTIVDPSAWSSSTLSRTWITSVQKIRRHYPEGKLYWLLISGGFRTYRFLPIFWQEFYPRYDKATPENISDLMHFLGYQRFGESYKHIAGIVRFPHPHVLRDELKEIPLERLQDPHIEFFAKYNPGYIRGDELVCLAEISEENLTKAGRRIWFSRNLVSSQKF